MYIFANRAVCQQGGERERGHYTVFASKIPVRSFTLCNAL
ncbi:hypothetical protein H206_03618 [Candidatus Electrothrix aarhusensis]|uniref:Uncharacterized protein n=1 Tax=Candidatus Electrothrix aarhusensis TaxID=1859131 RepID=A0A3S3QTI8_9BACT|nr:hypothetical protein H206_03618 [Candidatus Electrothrix aarhusensis]